MVQFTVAECHLGATVVDYPAACCTLAMHLPNEPGWVEAAAHVVTGNFAVTWVLPLPVKACHMHAAEPINMHNLSVCPRQAGVLLCEYLNVQACLAQE